mgnify:FL=1
MSENELRQEVKDLKERVSKLEAKLEDQPDIASKAIDISTFVQEFDPSTHAERAAAIAYYLENFEEQEQFTREDIEESYKRCRMNLQSNMSDVLASCEKKGWVMREGKDGNTNIRKLTMNGLNMVEEVMNDES